MPCTRPLFAWRSKRLNPETGKRPITFDIRKGYLDMPVELPCNNCIFCKLSHSRNMAIRCTHEASLHSQNSFLTLTYNDSHLPPNRFLDYSRPVRFMRDLRAWHTYYCKTHSLPWSSIRSFGCAEYGAKYARPHYHLCLFGFDFPDKIPFHSSSSHKLYTSPILSSLWPDGFSLIGSLTFESAAYVARYVTKKISGKMAPSHYETPDSLTGELLQRPPERSICVSSRPALGKSWFQQFSSDVYPSDEVIVRGHPSLPPKYYDRLLEVANPELYAKVKSDRKRTALENRALNPNEYQLPRSFEKEQVKLAEFTRLLRKYENDS